MDQARTIGDRVREARKRRGFTQDDLARAAGVSKSLISKLEQQSINDIRLETAHKIAATPRGTDPGRRQVHLPRGTAAASGQPVQ
jgi:transcriptional regulator with XRE-family HTH domain